MMRISFHTMCINHAKFMKREVGFIATRRVTFDVCDVAGNEVKAELTR